MTMTFFLRFFCFECLGYLGFLFISTVRILWVSGKSEKDLNVIDFQTLNAVQGDVYAVMFIANWILITLENVFSFCCMDSGIQSLIILKYLFDQATSVSAESSTYYAFETLSNSVLRTLVITSYLN